MITDRCQRDFHNLCSKPVSCECKCHKDRWGKYRVGGE